MKKLKKKAQQQEQGSKENKTCRDIKRTESLREGQYSELLETEKLNHAKVAGPSKGRKKSVQCIFENTTAVQVHMQAAAQKSWDTLAPEKKADCQNYKTRQASEYISFTCSKGLCQAFWDTCIFLKRKAVSTSVLACIFSVTFPTLLIAFTERWPFSLTSGFSQAAISIKRFKD